MTILKRHRELALASVVALALTGAAGAADLAVKAPVYAPPIPVYSWTGFYLGVGGGTGWGTKEYDWDITSTVNSVLGQLRGHPLRNRKVGVERGQVPVVDTNDAGSQSGSDRGLCLAVRLDERSDSDNGASSDEDGKAADGPA